MDNNKIIVGFTAKDSENMKGALATISETLDCTRITDLRTANTVINTSATLSEFSQYLQLKAFAIVNDREYWKLDEYTNEKGKKRKFGSFNEWIQYRYNMSKADASVKIRTAALIDETGKHSIFPTLDEHGSADYSVTALGIIAQMVSRECVVGKNKDGSDKKGKECDIARALDLHNNQIITPYMSVSDLKKALKAIDMKDEKADESEVTPTESEATPTESEATPTESEATPTEVDYITFIAFVRSHIKEHNGIIIVNGETFKVSIDD